MSLYSGLTGPMFPSHLLLLNMCMYLSLWVCTFSRAHQPLFLKVSSFIFPCKYLFYCCEPPPIPDSSIFYPFNQFNLEKVLYNLTGKPFIGFIPVFSLGWPSGAVINTFASQELGPGFDSLVSVHVISLSAGVPSGCSSFLPQPSV